MALSPTQFRHSHARAIIRQFDMSRGPLDRFIALSFRERPQLGSKDRAYISEIIYTYFRYKNLLEYLDPNDSFDVLEKQDTIQKALHDPTIPHHIRLCLPLSLYTSLKEEWGDEIEPLAQALNRPAPLTVRANTMKTTPQELIRRFESYGHRIIQDTVIEEALHFQTKASLFNLAEFQHGFFEIQDVGSQMVSRLIEVRPKQHVLDYCAGSGGKTLAIAPQLKNSGQMYLHDVRSSALLEAKKRLRRAGVQNAQWILSSEEEKVQKLENKMDWVLVDAPCSGTGTLRRNPDMKWKFSSEGVEELHLLQKTIVRKARSFMKPGGHLVYATCSLLRKENEDIVAFAQEELGLHVDSSSILKIAPHTGPWDGFFAVRFCSK